MQHQDGRQPDTPIAPSVADREYGPVQEAQFIPGGRSVPMMNAFVWVADAWGLFKQKPVMWVVIWIGFMLVCTVFFNLSRHTSYSGVIMTFAQILFFAGVVNSCDVLRREGSFTFSDLFVAFKRKTNSLLTVGLINFGFGIALAYIAIALIGGDAIREIFADLQSLLFHISSLTTVGITSRMMLLGAIIIVGTPIYTMAFWFTPALVLMHDIPLVKAIRMSFSACLKNILPGIILFSMMTIVIGISFIPFFLGLLGLLVMGMMSFMCNYTSYRDIFFTKITSVLFG